jgi:cell division protein FtsW
MATIEAPTRGRASTAERVTERLGGWSSPVTSYYLIAGVTALLLLLGLVMVLSSSTISSIRQNGSPYAVFLEQAQFALMGLPIMLVAARLPVRFYRKAAWPGLILAFGLQLLIFTPLAVGKNGNKSWVSIPGIGQTFQPSEFVKVALVVWLAAVLAAKRPLLNDPRHVLVPGVLVAVAALGLVLYGRDLGSVLIMIALVAGALYVAGVPMWMFSIAGGAAAVGVAFLTVTSENRMARLLAFLRIGEVDTQAEGFQTLHGLWGLGTGGISGVGLGASREKWLYLPEAHNDFIFAIIGEELGLLGTLLVLVLFAALAVGLTRVIARHPDPFVKIATGAAAAWILTQSLVNIGVVIGVLPVIGVPLPLLSAGGSALITTMAVLGMVLAFARDEPGAADALTARRGAVRRSLAVVARRGRRG